jgi:hypothetical protein
VDRGWQSVIGRAISPPTADMKHLHDATDHLAVPPARTGVGRRDVANPGRRQRAPRSGLAASARGDPFVRVCCGPCASRAAQDSQTSDCGDPLLRPGFLSMKVTWITECQRAAPELRRISGKRR